MPGRRPCPALQGAIKKSEALTVCLLAVVVACFLVDLIVSKPPVSKLVGGLKPTMGREHLYTAVSLLGANVMPHSFYLHRWVGGGALGGRVGEGGEGSACLLVKEEEGGVVVVGAGAWCNVR